MNTINPVDTVENPDKTDNSEDINFRKIKRNRKTIKNELKSPMQLCLCELLII